MSFLRRLDDRVLPAVTRVIERLIRRRVVFGWLAVAVGVTVVGIVIVNAQRAPGELTPLARSVTKVGPVDGTIIAGYLASSERELTSLSSSSTDQGVYALVSLTGYGTPAQVASLSNGYAVSKAYFRVPLVGVQTEIKSVAVADVQRDLETQMRRAATDADNDAEQAEAQAARLTGSASQERQLRVFYSDSARLLRVQARQFRSLCACVYSFVVNATPQQLTTLTKRVGVRVVDPAPEVSSLDRTVFLPLLPEQRSTVEPPSDTGLAPLPTPSPGSK